MFIKGKYCIINGEIKAATNFHDDFIVSGKSIYEVVRIFNSNPVFLDQHLSRLTQSAQITQIGYPQTDEIKQSIEQLIQASHQENGNIEIVVNNKKNWSARFIPHHYPTTHDYTYGVKTMFFEAKRDNPNAKVKLLDLRSAATDYIEQNNIYEAIYVNNGEIFEGSRSNIFFVDGQHFSTPTVQTVLPGITRQIVIELIGQANFQIEERPVRTLEAHNFDAAFLTGTSPGVLPISQINNINFNVNNKTMRHIMELYKKEVSRK